MAPLAKAKKRAASKPASRKSRAASSTRRSTKADVETALAWLRRQGDKRTLDDMGPRYGIHTSKAFGVPVGKIKQLGKSLGKDHQLAEALWQTGWYEARMLAAFVDEPERVTAAQMDRWRRDFDNWAICDTVCFHLFDRSPHAFRKAAQWSRRKEEFAKRAGFALMACVALHNKSAPDGPFQEMLPLIEQGASDDRNFVKKSVSWALRAIGRRNKTLKKSAVQVARRLAKSEIAPCRWVGKDALKEL